MKPRSDIKQIPTRLCAACGMALQRKRINGRLEDCGVFQRRMYCDRKCMSVGHTKEVCSSLSHSRIKAHRLVKTHCEMCATTGRLHVHHKDANPHNNALANLMTLCPSCHQQIHSPYFDKEKMARVPCLYCDNAAVKAGLCNSHLTRLRKHGDPTLTKVKMPGGKFALIRSASIRMPPQRPE